MDTLLSLQILSVLIARRISQGRLSRRFHKERDCLFLQEAKGWLYGLNLLVGWCYSTNGFIELHHGHDPTGIMETWWDASYNWNVGKIGRAHV